jgi:glycosyltransferase involved in cell wall biosynthesis
MLTIVTPTYNRKKEIRSLYDSLKKQNRIDFIWLIVDDGSTDNTKEYINEIKDRSAFNIQYFYKSNEGKHIAINFALTLIKTDLFMIVDSDDHLTNDATEIVYRDWWGISHSDDICGMCYLKGFNENCVVGEKFVRYSCIDTYINYRINSGVRGDKAEVWKTSAFENLRFPQFAEEKFFGEAYLWVQASANKKMYFKNEIIYICEYLDGGLTKLGRQLRIRTPLGGKEHARIFLGNDFIFKIRFKNMILYNCYSFFAKENSIKVVAETNYKLLSISSLPFAYGLYCYWKIRYF